MTRTKWIFASMGFGMLVLSLGVTVISPKLITWYYEPPANIGVSCGPSIASAFHWYQVFQLGSLLVGAVLGLFLGFSLTKKKKDHPLPNSTKV